MQAPANTQRDIGDFIRDMPHGVVDTYGVSLRPPVRADTTRTAGPADRRQQPEEEQD